MDDVTIAWALRDFLADQNGGSAPSPQELYEAWTLFEHYYQENYGQTRYPEVIVP